MNEDSALNAAETKIDAAEQDCYGRPLDYKIVNSRVRSALASGAKNIAIDGVMGQRYIAAAASSDAYIAVRGTPGNNLGAFMDGPSVEVFGNAQDMTGNTMSSGKIVVHGNAWDVTGLSMRGGQIFVQGNSGTRVGIHMKEFGDMHPQIVIGGRTGDYLGEYMAGGMILVLGENIPHDVSPIGLSAGAGIHGGSIIVRGNVSEHQLGVGARLAELSEEDTSAVNNLIRQYEGYFGALSAKDTFVKIVPVSSRPFRGHFDPTPI